MLMGTISFAGSLDVHTDVENVVYTNDNEVIRLVLDLGDMTNLSSAEVENLIIDFINNNVKGNEELKCSVTVSGSVSVGVAEIEISVTVSGDCDEIAENGAEVANQVLTAVKEAIKNAF